MRIIMLRETYLRPTGTLRTGTTRLALNHHFVGGGSKLELLSVLTRHV